MCYRGSLLSRHSVSRRLMLRGLAPISQSASSDRRPRVCFMHLNLNLNLPCAQLTNAAVDGNHGAIDGEVRLLPTAGTLVLMHTRCYHRVDTNHTDVPRVMLNTRATARDARDDLCRYPVFVSQTWDHATGEPW
jgi:hypothetical protein